MEGRSIESQDWEWAAQWDNLLDVHDLFGDKFDQALVYVVRRLGQVNVTKLEKILYLADLEYFHRTGATLTGVRWIRYKLGPLAKRLFHSQRELDGHEVVVTHEQQGENVAHAFRPGPEPRFEPELSPLEQATLDKILAIAEPLNWEAMVKMAYNTTPMRFLLSREDETPRLGAAIPFELDLDVVANTTGEDPAESPASRAAFKRAELARIADIQEELLSQANG